MRDGKGKAIQFIDVFAGIGGMRLAGESLGWDCVWSCEIDKFARQMYQANFPDGAHIRHDIRHVKPEEIPAHDVLMAGFPCQPFSIAGVSKRNSMGLPTGFEDTRGTLFFELTRLLRHHRPAGFLLENVPHLLSHDKGRTFDVIRRSLDDLGYHVAYDIVDSAPWVPQRRRRLFIVGMRDRPVEWTLALPLTDRNPCLADILEEGVSDRYVLGDRTWASMQAHAERHRRKGNGFGYHLHDPQDISHTLPARYYKDGGNCLIRMPHGNPRRLTPRECSRLMGFDRHGREFQIPLSDSQAYRVFGNAVVPAVAQAVGVMLRLAL